MVFKVISACFFSVEVLKPVKVIMLTAESMPMMVTTTSNSIKVNPRHSLCFIILIVYSILIVAVILSPVAHPVFVQVFIKTLVPETLKLTNHSLNAELLLTALTDVEYGFLSAMVATAPATALAAVGGQS